MSSRTQAKAPEPASGTTTLWESLDRKSTRLNSSHMSISYAVFCLKKKKKQADNLGEPLQDRQRTISVKPLAIQQHTLTMLEDDITSDVQQQDHHTRPRVHRWPERC